MSEQNRTEEFSVNGDQVVEKVKQLIKEGNVHQERKRRKHHGIPCHCWRGRRTATANTRSTRRSSGIDGAVHDRGRAAGLESYTR